VRAYWHKEYGAVIPNSSTKLFSKLSLDEVVKKIKPLGAAPIFGRTSFQPFKC